MRKTVYIALGAIILVIAAAFAWTTLSKPPQTVTLPGRSDAPNSANAFAIGEIQGISSEARTLALRQAAGAMAVSFRDDTPVLSESGATTTPAYLKKGFTVRAYGLKSGAGSMAATRIEVEKAPNIIVYEPAPGASVSTSSIRVAGIARVFENQFDVRIAADGKKVLEKPVHLLNGEMGSFGDFDTTLSLAPYAKALANATSVAIEAFEYSAKDGREINKVAVPVTLEQATTTALKAYFLNSKLDPAFTCTKVFPVTRTVPRTASVARAAVEELLKGPTAEEKAQGYETAINPGVKLQNIGIANGTARADFDPALQDKVGGSCRTASIRWQIIQTLKQFPTVRSVVISINGDSETILQP